MPQLGLGVCQTPDSDASSLIHRAFEIGYRRLDTAATYGNEDIVGRSIATSGLEREDLFVTTKVWNDDHGYDKTLKALDKSPSVSMAISFCP